MTESTVQTVKHSDLTPYRAAQVATAVLRAAGKLQGVDSNGKPKAIEPQTMYSNKSIKRYGEAKRDGGTGVMFVGESFNEWLQSQLRGTGSTRTRSNFGSLLAEYTVEIDDEDVADEPEDGDEDSAEDIAAMAENGAEAKELFDEIVTEPAIAAAEVKAAEKSEDEELAELEASDGEVAE
jgi:hypothetical protein